MREIRLIESTSHLVELSKQEAQILASIGKELASSKTWWGGGIANPDSSVIIVSEKPGDKYELNFRDVVGLISLPSVHFHIDPKIPWEHFVEIISNTDLSPKISNKEALVDKGELFIELISNWYLEAAEKLVRSGLRQGYVSITSEIEELRGSLHPVETSIRNLQGIASAVCSYDELSFDMPLNRILFEACQIITKLSCVGVDLRQRARRLAFRIGGVGKLQNSDLRSQTDRLTRHYYKSIQLAKLLINGCGVTVSNGSISGTSFLLRTPDIIEDGLRNIIDKGLSETQVKKKKLMIGAEGLSVNPDIVFGQNRAVADVKYKLFKNDWNRPDLNQIITFAAAFKTSKAAVIGFSSDSSEKKPSEVKIGDIWASSFTWDASDQSSPANSSKKLVDDIFKWL